MTRGDILYNQRNGQSGIFLSPIGQRYLSVIVFERVGDTIRKRSRTTWMRDHVRGDGTWGMEIVDAAKTMAKEVMGE